MKSDKKKKEKFLFQKLNLLKTKVISMHYTKFSEDEIKKILILPFMQITGYEISDKNIFKINKKTDENSADYIIQKESKPIIFVKYVKIDDSIFDFKNNVYFGCKQFSNLAGITFNADFTFSNKEFPRSVFTKTKETPLLSLLKSTSVFSQPQ